jgi:hypothetical protein
MKKTLLCCLLALVLLPLYAEKPRRYVEIGVDMDASAANNYLGLFDVFNRDRTIVIEPARLSKSGLWLNGVLGTDVFFNINFGEKFGLGFFAGFDTAMYSGTSGELFRILAEGNRDMRDFTVAMSTGGSAFADAGLDTRFKFGKLSLKVSPAAYVPILYVPPLQMSYHVDTTEGLQADVHVQAEGYMPISPDDFVNFSVLSDSGSGSSSGSGSGSGIFGIVDQRALMTNLWHILEAWGLDLSLDAEYALNSQWDLGGSIASIPLYPSTLRHGASFQFDYTLDLPGDGDLIEMIRNDEFDQVVDLPEISEPVVSDDLAFRAFRPLRFDVYAQYKPLSTNLIVLKPDIGFSALTVYGYEASGMCFNAGLEAQLNLKRIFSLSLASGYRERIWHHGLGLMLNLRIFQLNLGLSLQSQSFVNSFKLNGLGLAVGLRFGF